MYPTRVTKFHRIPLMRLMNSSTALRVRLHLLQSEEVLVDPRNQELQRELLDQEVAPLGYTLRMQMSIITTQMIVLLCQPLSDDIDV